LPIARFGNDELKQRFLPYLLTGRTMAAFGLTEPDGGSDAGATATRARWDAEKQEWVLSGEKAFITNSGWATTSVITVTARHDDSAAHVGVAAGDISAFCVPVGTTGLSVGAPYDKLGWHASDTHPVYLDQVRVGADYLLGAPGAGFKQMLRTLDEGRIAISALACGVLTACLDAALEHAKTRVAFGKPIGEFQGVAFSISDMATDLAAARALTYQAALDADAGRPIRQSASIAKVFSTERAIDATRAATQVLGGLGYLEDSPIARHYRDSKILEVGEGTSEIQRIVIARTLGLKV
jgi:butyryl-CoA dehydrogenase